MTVPPVKFLFGFLLVSILLWLLFISANRLLARILGKIVGATIELRFGGWKCLREVTVKFKKGPVASVSIGEVRLSLRRPLLNLGFGFAYPDSKLQILISDIEVVLRPSVKGAQKVTSRRSRSSGKRKWMVLANMARFLSVSVTDLVVKVPKFTTEIKELKVDISKDGASKPTLLVKLNAFPIFLLLEESRVSVDEICNYSTTGNHVSLTGKSSAPFYCEEVSFSCEFGHDSKVGVILKNVDIICGEVHVNVNGMLERKTSSVDIVAPADELDSFDAEKDLHKKQKGLASVTKYTSMFPEKVCFTLPTLDVRFLEMEQNLTVENKITGIQLKCIKSKSTEDVGDTTRFDVQMDFSEIHVARGSGTSILEILKVDILSFLYVPSQPASPIRAEIDIKLGGTQCNLQLSRLEPWMHLKFLKSKTSARQYSRQNIQLRTSDSKQFIWTCTASAPEMTVILYSLSGSPLYHGCSQSSRVYANNISSTGTNIHSEFGEINLHLASEYQEYSKECLFGVESNSGSLMHIAKISIDWGKKDIESPDEYDRVSRLALLIEITGMDIHFTFERVECLVSSALSFQSFFKSILASQKNVKPKHGQPILKQSGKGARLLNFNLERCTVKFSGETDIDSSVIPDPKRVNYGSQGGKFVVNVSTDGKERSAEIFFRVPEAVKKLKYSVSLDVSHFSLSMNKDKQSFQVELERAKIVYHDYLEDHKPATKLTLLDVQHAKFVRRDGGLKEIAVCSLFSASDITMRWEPDMQICLFELFLRLKLMVHNKKLQGHGDENNSRNMSSVEIDGRESITEPGRSDRNHKKKESVFAVDVEMLSVYAEVGDGVDAVAQIHSIFSENARIGILFEGLLLSLNGSKVFKSSRMQISRVPSMLGTPSSWKSAATKWDWVIQGLDVHICMPYRLQLRAIEDSIEDMLRGLKLICSAKTKFLFPAKKESTKAKVPNPLMLGCVRLCIRKLTTAIEEEPIQGWLDEHYHLMKNEANELAVRLKFLDDAISKARQCAGKGETNDSMHGRKVQFDDKEIDMLDPSAVKKLREHIYRQSFRSYYNACQKLSVSEGSGASSSILQSGFKPSNNRAHLLSITASDLDASFIPIDGGEAGLIEVINKLDPISLQNAIPFSRLYGSNIHLNTGTLVVQLRNYTFPIFKGTSGRCKGSIILAQQATAFQPQVHHDVFIGRWWKVQMLRSASGTTPPMKTYLDLPLHFQNAHFGFGVGFEPAFADISYAFTVALRRANLSVKGAITQPPLPKKERSLPWWDDIRYYVHGNITFVFGETKWKILATTDPYEKLDKLQISSGHMKIIQSDGHVHVTANEFKMQVSSLESLMINHTLKIPTSRASAFLEAPDFVLDVTMEWECESGNPLNHYLHALPVEGRPREKVYDPFRSTSLSLGWIFSLKPSQPPSERVSSPSMFGVTGINNQNILSLLNGTTHNLISVPTMNMGAHDLAWLIKFWNMNYFPPHKLRSFSRWPRFGIPRAARSGNLSLDKVMTEFMLRIDATPSCIKHKPLDDDDPAQGLTFNMTKLKYELYYSRGKQKYTFDCKRDPLDLVYRGLDLHMPVVCLNKADCSRSTEYGQTTIKKGTYFSGSKERSCDGGFFLSSDYFTIRRQAPKADPSRLIAWQEAGRNLEMTYVRSEFENGSDSDERARSEPSDDDGYNIVIADNCQRVFIYGLKLLWTIENRDAVWSWVGGISKAFEPPKPSASRQYNQNKSVEEKLDGSGKCQDDSNQSIDGHTPASSSSKPSDNMELHASSPCLVRMEDPSANFPINTGQSESDEEGTRHFMVNVIEPQFNLHSEEANGRFLLAAVSGRVLARSIDSLVQVGVEVIEQALGSKTARVPEYKPELKWKRMEFSVMLEHVQAHVAPTDVDPGAGLQWLPKILRSSPKVNRTGALLERVFMPCNMYFQYTRHKGGTADLKMKPLKQLMFNSNNIAATMTARQFQVMLDVLTNLLFARLPKPRKSSLSYPTDNDDDDVEEEADEVVPEGVKEVELAKVYLEQKEQQHRLLLTDIRKLSVIEDLCTEHSIKDETDLWMVNGGRNMLITRLKKELENAQKSRKGASLALRKALQKAAQLRLMEKEKNKSPSYAMQISLEIKKVVWGMLVDGKPFAEAEINDLKYDFNRDYKDVGVARFTTNFFVVRNCLPNPKSNMVLSAWNPPPDWGKKVMLHVDAQQGAPSDGTSHLERFQVQIYPLKIHLTETMYKMMWEYFFPEEEQDSQQRQEVWKVSTTAGSKRVKKSLSIHDAFTSNSMKEADVLPKSGNSMAFTPATGVSSSESSLAHGSNVPNPKVASVCGSAPEAPSFGRPREDNATESTADDLIFQPPSEITGSTDQSAESSKYKLKDVKHTKSGRSSHEDKKNGKAPEEKRPRPRKLMEFHNIKISQVELLLTYEGSRFVVNDLKLLMDTFHRDEFTGTWRRLFSKVKKHIIWGVLKSVTGMQGKKFKDKDHGHKLISGVGIPENDLILSDNESQGGTSGQYPASWMKRPSEGAGDGFVTSIRGLFNTQRRRAKAFVLRTMRGEAENEFQGEWSDSDGEYPFARQLTITKMSKKLIRRHTKKFRSRGHKGSSSQQRDSLPSSPRETTPIESDSSSEPYKDSNDDKSFHDVAVTLPILSPKFKTNGML